MATLQVAAKSGRLFTWEVKIMSRFRHILKIPRWSKLYLKLFQGFLGGRSLHCSWLWAGAVTPQIVHENQAHVIHKYDFETSVKKVRSVCLTRVNRRDAKHLKSLTQWWQFQLTVAVVKSAYRRKGRKCHYFLHQWSSFNVYTQKLPPFSGESQVVSWVFGRV